MIEFASLFSTATYITLGVEFAFGFALGYFLGKLVKALIALMVISFVGVLVNFSQFAALSDAVLQQLGISPAQFVNIAGVIMLFLGMTVIIPLASGLVLGYLIGR
ncbi:MAG: hypothetical protein ACUVT5_07560 [Candidatus Bathyarchaeales archaeon]